MHDGQPCVRYGRRILLLHNYTEYTQSRQSICENSVLVTYTANYLIKYQYKKHQGRPGKN